MLVWEQPAQVTGTSGVSVRIPTVCPGLLGFSSALSCRSNKTSKLTCSRLAPTTTGERAYFPGATELTDVKQSLLNQLRGIERVDKYQN